MASEDDDIAVPVAPAEEDPPELEVLGPDVREDDRTAQLLPADLRLVVFDLAGTTLDDMVDGQPLAIAAIQRAFARADIEVSSAALTPLRGLEKREAIRQLCHRLLGNGREAEANELAAAVNGNFSEALSEGLRQSHLREVPGTSEVFRALRARGARVVIGSGFEEAVVRDIVLRLGWEVDGVVAARRPRPDAIFKAIGMADIDRVGQVLKVGDTVADIEEGRNAGVWTAAVLTGTQGEATLRDARPDFVLGSVADILDMLPPLQDSDDDVQVGPQLELEKPQGALLQRPKAPTVGPQQQEQSLQQNAPGANSNEGVFLRGELPHRKQETATIAEEDKARSPL